MAIGSAMLERAKRASHIKSTSVTLRHHAEGMFLTAERTLDPARLFEESLTPRPELENRICEVADKARGVCVDGPVSGRREPSTRINAKHLKLLPSELTRLRWFYGGCVSRGARGSCRRGLADSAFDLHPHP